MSNNYYHSSPASESGGNVEGSPSPLIQEDCSDLTLIVEDQRFPVHRVILAARSIYFHAMLFCGMRETNENEITLVDTPADAFKALLKYIYTGKLQLKSLKLDLVLDMLGLVHKYGFSDLEETIPEFLKHYSIECLMTTCLDFIDNCATELLGTQAFIDLPAQALVKILSRNSFCAPEIEIFNAVKQWIETHPDEEPEFSSILAQIRLPLIKVNDLFEHVRESSLISPDQILDAIKDQNTLSSSQLKYRGFLFPGINIATVSFGAKVISGDFRTALLSNPSNYDEGVPTDRTFSKHLINPRDPGITIELGRPFIINCIKFQLMDRDQRAFSYYIEVSIDKNDWVRVIDHTLYLCRSKQNLFFESRVVKFIRIVGTLSSVNNTFQLCNFEALCTTEQFEIDTKTTLQIPRFNIATISNNAIVTEGVSRSRNALLNGDTTNYDWDNGYTCHQLGSGALVVQLPQPYLIETMRFLLWDCDDRCYSFYVEVSIDQIKWTKVVEFNECKSWQIAQFERISVVFVRIVGTYNSANEVFHCVHFECPAMDINEDTFLLIDALSKERDVIIPLNPLICLEIGCGSGIVTCFLQKLLKNNLLTRVICTDLNLSALKCTENTAKLNSIGLEFLEFVQCDAIGPLLPRLYNSLDLLLLNPPYVLTEENPENEKDICFAGGPEGRNLLNKLLPFISKLLSPNGIFYLVAIKENNIADLISEKNREKFGLNGVIILERQCKNEYLYVLKFTRFDKENESNLKSSSIQKSCIKEIQINTPKTGTITSTKITLHLKPVGNAPQLRKEFTKYKVDPNWTIFNLQQTLKKLLGVKTDPIYLFIKEAFAPSPESTISSLYQCFGTDGGILYIHYGLTPAWG
uniref:Methyltransferase HEMK2 n=1 Tax=Meloidogyne javanica TaxID=6303 RepID=A0A915MFX6_MELJA